MWVIGLPMIAAIAVGAVAYLFAAWRVVSRWGFLTRRQRIHAAISSICIFLFLGGIANFAVFWTVSVSIGGDAVAGGVEQGYVQQDYPPDEPPPTAIRLYQELIDRDVRFQTVGRSRLR